MARLNIEIDGDNNPQLTELAASEAEHGDSLRSIRDEAEADFTANRTVSWNGVKIRNGL